MDVHSISYLESAKRMRTLLQVSPSLENIFQTHFIPSFFACNSIIHFLSEFRFVAVYFFLFFTLNVQTGLLRHTDLNNNPERFFLAHRLLARHAPASILRLVSLNVERTFLRFLKIACLPNAFSGARIRWAFLRLLSACLDNCRSMSKTCL
jgi:hypothetical protein